MTNDDVFANHVLELRRGSIVLVILSQLRVPRYGYNLLQQLASADFTIDAGTLYPLLRRLEKQGTLESFWDTSESRPRKYYRMSNAGEELYVRLCNEWLQMTKSIDTMTGGVA